MILGGGADLARGYLIMAVREVRWGRAALGEGDTYAALNRLCWGWRYLTLAERAMGGAERAPAGLLRSHTRACAAVEAVQRDFVAAWPQRYAFVRSEMAARA